MFIRLAAGLMERLRIHRAERLASGLIERLRITRAERLTAPLNVSRHVRLAEGST